MMNPWYVIYAMAAVLPFALLWYALLTGWKRAQGGAPAKFSLYSGLLALLISLLLQFQMTAQAEIPGPDRDLYPQFWLACLLLFSYGMPATWVGLFMRRLTAGSPAARVPHCSHCGNREHLHTEYCVRCGHRFS